MIDDHIKTSLPLYKHLTKQGNCPAQLIQPQPIGPKLTWTSFVNDTLHWTKSLTFTYVTAKVLVVPAAIVWPDLSVTSPVVAPTSNVPASLPVSV